MAVINQINAGGTAYDVQGVHRVTMGTSTATAFVASTATGESVTALYDGLTIVCKNTSGVASASGCTLNLNGLGAKSIWLSQSNSACTTHWGKNQTYMFIYDATNTRWELQQGRDTDSTTTNATQIQMNSNAVKCGSTAIVAANIIVANSDGLYKHLKAGTAFDITWPILYAAKAIAASATSNDVYREINFTVTTTQSITLTAQKPVYIKGTLSGTTFTPVSTTPLTQTIPTSDDGYQYIYLGYGYSTTAVRLQVDHPIYAYKNGKFGLVANDASSVNGHTVATNVPSGAVFTDKYHKTGSWNGLTYTASAVNSADALAFTIPTGTSATTVCVGDDSRLSDSRTPTSHTHGNIQNGGTLQTSDITIANGDKIIVTDSSDSSKIARTSIAFDGSTATQCLTKKGTWASFTNNAGTITSVKTTAGTHSTINVTSGAANFNVPTKTSHLTNDSNYVVGSSTSEGYLALLTAANTIGNGPKIIPFRKITNITGTSSFSYTGVSFTVPSGYFAILSVRARFVYVQPDQVAVNTSSTTLGDYQIISISESGNTSLCYYNAEGTTATFYVWAKYYTAGNSRIDIEGIYLTNLGTFVDTI